MQTDMARIRPQRRVAAAGRRVIRHLPVRLPTAVLVAAVLSVAWMVVAPRTPDLAGQVYRADLFARAGMVVWDGNWYGGHYIPAYSLIFPPLGALLGVRVVGALAVVASSAVFCRIARLTYGEGTAPAAVWFACAAAGGLWIGRVTFALGVAAALGAVLSVVGMKGWRAAAAGVAFAAACTACSPVAGLLLALAVASHALASRRAWPGGVLVGAVLLVALPLEGIFPDGGWEPYGAKSFAAACAVGVGVLLALPRREPVLRVGAVGFLAANAVAMAVKTPMGSNIERYAVLLAGPVLLCALSRRGEARRDWARWRVGLAWMALAGTAVWVAWGPIKQNAEVWGDRSTQASFYLPVRRYLATHAPRPVRVEVPFTRSHWESALLGEDVALAGGWERQLAKRYNRAIEADPLAPRTYRRWLWHTGVAYVALPDVPLDGASEGEAAVIRSQPRYLREVFVGGGWRIYRVLGARPLAEGPGMMTGMGNDWFALRARSKGRFLVRVRYTPYWKVETGAGSVARGPAGWTYVRADRAEVLRMKASFSAGAALRAL